MFLEKRHIESSTLSTAFTATPQVTCRRDLPAIDFGSVETRDAGSGVGERKDVATMWQVARAQFKRGSRWPAELHRRTVSLLPAIRVRATPSPNRTKNPHLVFTLLVGRPEVHFFSPARRPPAPGVRHRALCPMSF